ncbi:MAG: hypothetical protein V1792_10735 [Pseudomonadota bacterium]
MPILTRYMIDLKLESIPFMTIRFSCHCGALFEVPDDQAGLVGRCRNCGQEMTIPHASSPGGDSTEELDKPSSDLADSSPFVPEEDRHVTETGHIRYCPFCGNPVDQHSDFCTGCRKVLGSQPDRDGYLDPFTPIDWTLTTIFAPVGFVLGFVSLASGRRKGLHMMGVSTASIFMLWLLSAVMSWLR